MVCSIFFCDVMEDSPRNIEPKRGFVDARLDDWLLNAATDFQLRR